MSYFGTAADLGTRLTIAEAPRARPPRRADRLVERGARIRRVRRRERVHSYPDHLRPRRRGHYRPRASSFSFAGTAVESERPPAAAKTSTGFTARPGSCSRGRLVGASNEVATFHQAVVQNRRDHTSCERGRSGRGAYCRARPHTRAYLWPAWPGLMSYTAIGRRA